MAENNSEVLNRRLRPVYDHIDLGNNKKALQEVEKVLKKTPKLQNARALKALSLIRLGREKESQVIIDDLENENVDEPTLQVMTYWYKETDQLDKICKVYTNAVKSQPGNEDLLTQLFMSHVRVNDYKSQQTVALQLYKAKPKNPYYFWAVWSIVLQALRGPDSSNKNKAKLLLSLAERMIDKIIAEEKIDAEQEVQLHLSVLQYQDKFQETLDFLEGPICAAFYPGAPIAIKIELYKKLNRWVDLNKLMKKLLLEDPDRWDYQQDYLTSCFELMKAEDKSEDVDNTIELCHEFICQLIENKEKKVRGPYLARLELHKRMRDNSMNATELLGDYFDLLIEYFNIFGDKKCCANDLKLFIEFLEPYRRPGLASQLIKNSGISSTTLPQNKEQLQKHICSLQISRICGAHAHASLTIDHLQALYSAFFLHYEHSFQAFGSNLLPTDIGPSDQYALLAAHVMYDLSIKTKSADRLVEALHLLNYLLKNSPSNFHAKLLCLQIYHILGCALGAHKIYESLDIKHVQLDSLGYLHCAHLPSSGLPTISKPLYDQTLKFFTQSYKDSLEYLAMSYKFGSFSKLQEFMDFREKLSNSLHYSLVSVEALLLEISCFSGNSQQNLQQLTNMKIEPNEDRIKYDELSDNRDLEVIIRWDPTYQYSNDDGSSIEPIPIHQKVKENEKESFTQNVELLQMRSCLLRYIAASVELISVPYTQTVANGETTTKNSGQADKEEIYTILIESWCELYHRIKKLNYKPTSSEFLVNLLPSRLHQMIKLPYEVIFTCLGKFVLNLWKGSSKSSSSQENLTKSFDSILIFLKDFQSDKDVKSDIWYHKNFRDGIVGCVEILSLCSFVLSTCYEKYYQLCNQSQQGSKKKKNQNQASNINHVENNLTDKERVALVADVLKALRTCFQDMETVIDKWQPQKIEKTLNEYLASLSITPKPSETIKTEAATTTALTIVDINVNTIFNESHQQTTKELKSLIKDKLKMINVK